MVGSSIFAKNSISIMKDYKKEDNSMKDFLKRTGKTLFHAFEAGIGIACLTIGVIVIKRDIFSNN